MKLLLGLVLTLSLFFIIGARAESHTIKFVNQCGFGTPALMYNGQNILSGDEYTSNGPFSGIAYLQTGRCNTNGENCTLLEMTLIDATCAGCGSSTDISLIPPHAYSVESSFAYYNGCDGVGQTCSSPNCSQNAFFVSTDTFVQRACQANNVNLLISFCAEASQLVGGGNSLSSATSSATPASTSGGTKTSAGYEATVAAQPSFTQSSAPAYIPTPTPSVPSAAAPPPVPSTSPSPSPSAKTCAPGSRRMRRVLRYRSAKPGH